MRFAIRPRLVVLVFLALAAGCLNKPADPPNGGPKADPAQPAGLVDAKPDVVLTAAELRKEDVEDGEAFNRKYEGKLVEVSGVVKSYDYTLGGEGRLWLEGPAHPKFLCQDPRPAARAMPGQTVFLRGRCEPRLGVRGWVIANVTGDPPPTVAAEDLAREVETDPDGASKKYRGKYLIVTGRITKLEDNIVSLTPPGQKTVVKCGFPAASRKEEERNKTLQVGQKIKVLGESILGGAQLSLCELVEVSP
jgi:hypothetical protein